MINACIEGPSPHIIECFRHDHVTLLFVMVSNFLHQLASLYILPLIIGAIVMASYPNNLLLNKTPLTGPGFVGLTTPMKHGQEPHTRGALLISYGRGGEVTDGKFYGHLN